MSRHTLGVVAIFLLIVGGIIALQQPEGGAAFAGACIRVGMVLGAVWLAWPQVASFWNKTPRWLLIASAVAVVVCVVHPLLALAAIPVLALLWFAGPKVVTFWKPKPGGKSPTDPRPPADRPAAATQATSLPKRPRRRPNAR